MLELNQAFQILNDQNRRFNYNITTESDFSFPGENNRSRSSPRHKSPPRHRSPPRNRSPPKQRSPSRNRDHETRSSSASPTDNKTNKQSVKTTLIFVVSVIFLICVGHTCIYVGLTLNPNPIKSLEMSRYSLMMTQFVYSS